MPNINGLLHYPQSGRLTQAIQGMNQALNPSSPAEQAQWQDTQRGIALGHGLLRHGSNCDQQPIPSDDGRYCMLLNGQIYNQHQLQQALERDTICDGPRPTDRNILLAGFAHWGIEAMLKRISGMFAIALWDRQQQLLYLMRDRVGEKPLYYGQLGQCFAFSSELAALRNLPLFQASVDRCALDTYLHYGYIPAPQSIYRGIHKLSPGSVLTLDYKTYCQHKSLQAAITQRQWWSFVHTAQQAQRRLITDEQDAKNRLRQQLQHSVSQQSITSTNVGTFLSGGIASTTVLNQLCKVNDAQNVHTFTLSPAQSNSTQYADSTAQQAVALAQHFGTVHETITLNAAAAQAVVPQLAQVHAEPCASVAQISTQLLAQHAGQQVNVALSGIAGNELFAGHSRYLHSPAIWAKVRHLPLFLRNRLAQLLIRVNTQHWDFLAEQLNKRQLRGAHLHKLGYSLHNCRTLEDFFNRFGLQLSKADSWVIGGNPQADSSPQTLPPQAIDFQSVYLSDDIWHSFTAEAEHAMMLSDSTHHLPNSMLCTVDRATMAVGLEMRTPLLDHQLIKLAWRLPLTMKIHHGQGKHILRQLLSEDIPIELLAQPKQASHLPLNYWLRNELRDWAEDLLDEHRLRREGYLHTAKVRNSWQQFLRGQHNNQKLLWHVLMFQTWQERWLT